MRAISSNKKIIAKEIIVLFSGIALIILILGFVLLRNFYLSYEIKRNNKKVNSINRQLYELTKTGLWGVYASVNPYFVVTYDLKGEFPVAKKQEKQFLSEYHNKKYELRSLPLHKDRYYYYIRPDPLKLIERLHKRKDTVIVFEFVDFDEFKNLLRNDAYRINFHSFFSGNYDGFEWKHRRNIPIFDFGTLKEFTIKVEREISDTATRSLINGLNSSKSQMLADAERKRSNLWPSEKTKDFIISTGIILSIILFPIRWSILLVRWAINVLKENK